MEKAAAIFGGAGLGVLIGLLIGMSTSGTVGVVIGALSAVLLVLLGFKENGDSNVHAVRVGAFGIFCAAAILVGLYLRANNTFTPSITSEINRWTADSLFTLEEAKRYVLYDRFGFIPEGAAIDTTKQTERVLTQLYGTEISISDCEKVKGYQNFPIGNELKAYERLGGIWEKVSRAVSQNVEPADQKETLHLIRKCLCDE